MTWIASPDWCAEHFSGGYFSGGDEPDTFIALDGTKLHLNVPLCDGCDQPVDEHGYCGLCGEWADELEPKDIGGGRYRVAA